MSFTPIAEIDGYGDRMDIAIARDFGGADGIARTKRQELAEDEAALRRSTEFGILANARPLSEVILEMLKRECYGKLLLKGELIIEAETFADAIHDALEDACCQMGLGSDEFTLNYHDKGNQIDLRLVG